MAALVSLVIHEQTIEPDELPGELLTLTGVAGRLHPPSVARAWTVSTPYESRVTKSATPIRHPERSGVTGTAQSRDQPFPTVVIASRGTADPSTPHVPCSAQDDESCVVRSAQDDGKFVVPRSSIDDTVETHLEVEWQLDADDLLGIETALLGRPLELEPRVIPSGVVAIEDRYLDTGDLRLLRAGYAYRLRTTATGQELTLKATGTSRHGAHHRIERTQSLADGEDLDTVMARGEVGEIVRLVVGRRELTPLMEVRTNRRTFIITVNDIQTGEISLDRTSIMPSEAGEPVRLRRVEVEAIGDTDSIETIQKFAASLRKQHRLRWSRQSKFELGLQAGDWLRRAVIDLGSTEIRAGISIGELAQVVIRRHLTELHHHEPAARLGEDSEALHAMRVANRRLRADLRLFADVLPDSRQSIDDELRWLGGVLGAVRDLDIQLVRIDGWLSADTGNELVGLGEIRTSLEGRRIGARASLLEVLDGPRYDSLIERMIRMARDRNSPSPTFGAPAVDRGAKLLLGLERKMRSAANGLQPDDDPERFHELRIVCKRFRYALEAFAPLYGKPAERSIRRLVALQDLLGTHQDATVAAGELRALSQDASLPRATSFTLGRLAERSLIEAALLREAFPDIYRRVERGDWVKLRRRLRRLARSASNSHETPGD